MTFKGMLKILINDYRKQHEEKMFTLARELMKTQRELREVKEQLQTLHVNDATETLSQNDDASAPMIGLYVQYRGFFNQLRNIRQTMTVKELLAHIRQLIGIRTDRSIRIRVLSEDGLTTICFLHKKLHQTLQSYKWLQPRMILSIEDDDDDDIIHQDNPINQSESTISSNEQTRSFDESDV